MAAEPSENIHGHAPGFCLPQPLPTQFADRDALVAHVRALAPWAEGASSSIQGGHAMAERHLCAIAPIAYARTRNHGDGKITRLSPYLQHGMLSLNTVRNHALGLCSAPAQATKFIQELAWRDFWQRVLAAHPEWAWNDAEPYKTGFSPADYADTLPEDIATGNTGVACLDAFIHALLHTGYIHNHARMYLASYVVHFRRVKWQAGARWFLQHLLDGNTASNNLSWQWVASTFSNKPYIFNLENVQRYFGELIDTSPEHNRPLDYSYAALNASLFANLGPRP
ncbi:MAG: DNA photolyase [Azospirillum brasilense]|nr:MAG: DNA photolyase [Azospirillum brasilense]